MDKEKALKNLIDLDKIFRSESVDYWLQDGTLLGLYRDGDFIDHDQDTDIGINYKTFKPVVLDKIISNGFSVERAFGYIENSFELALKRDGVKTDLFFHYNNGDKQYHSAFIYFTKRIDYEYKKFKTKEVSFLDHNFMVPEDELEYIKTKYGESWQDPEPNWDWAFSPKNHKKTDITIDPKLASEKFINWLKKD